jgi:hypothetical protein
MARIAQRGFAMQTVPDDCTQHLKSLGITNKNVIFNPT